MLKPKSPQASFYGIRNRDNFTGEHNLGWSKTSPLNVGGDPCGRPLYRTETSPLPYKTKTLPTLSLGGLILIISQAYKPSILSSPCVSPFSLPTSFIASITPGV